MPVSPTLFVELLQKVREGTISPQEMALLQLFLSSAESDEVLEKLNFHGMPEASDAAFTPVEERLRNIQTVIARKKRIHRMRQWMVAASLFLLVGSATWLLLGRSKDRQPPTAADLTVFRSGDGELKQVRLPDGSEVSLNARSVLVYQRSFNVKDRVVELKEGEAFFDVRPDPVHPFLVRTRGGVDVNVLGTSFDCKVYRSNPRAEISIKTGKVRVSRQGSGIDPILLSGDRIAYNAKKGDWSVSRVDAGSIGEWRKGGVELQQADFTTLSEVMQEIYGVTLVADSSKITRNRYSIRIRYHADRRLLVEAIAAINGNKVQWESTDLVHFY